MDMTPEPVRIVLAIAINALAALATYQTRNISKSGAIGGFIIGALIYYLTDWRGYLILVTFFILGTLVTKLKYQEKASKGIAQEDKGRRSAKHAIANCSTSLILALIAFILYRLGNTSTADILMIGFTAAFATALSDTASSEIGQAYGKTTILLTNFRRVEPGTEGAVSIEGTIAGILGSIIIALVAFACGISSGWTGVLAIIVAAFIGNTIESIIGSTIEKISFITNEITNFLNTVIGASAAMLIFSFFG